MVVLASGFEQTRLAEPLRSDRPTTFVSHSGTWRKTQEDVTETLIRKRVEDLATAISAKDIDRVMALYARDLVSFDLTPPLRRFGADEKRRAWQEAFAALTGPIAYEVRDLDVTTNGEVAFVHSLKIGRAHV